MTHDFLRTYFDYGHGKIPYLKGADNGGNNVSCLRCYIPYPVQPPTAIKQ